MKDGYGMRFAAHRGICDPVRGIKENTLAAIKEAIAAGADLVEVDVRLTADGETVILHDPDMLRVWGDPRRIESVTMQDLRRCCNAADMRVPTLAETLETIRNTRSRLLIDMDDARFAAPAVAVVKDLHMERDVEWCGNLEGMQTIRAKDAQAVIWMPWRSPAPPRSEDIEALRPQVLNIPHLLAGQALVSAAHELGMTVFCWTVDHELQARHLAHINADGITTNLLNAIRACVLSADSSQEESREDRDDRARVVAEQIAEQTLELIRESGSAHRTHIHGKSTPADLVTDLDGLIEHGVREVLEAQFPEISIVGEEMGGEEPAQGDCWFLDPLDGSINYANGVPWFSFSLALVRDGSEPVVAAVIDPAEWRVITAARGQGAWSQGKRVTIPEHQADSDSRSLQNQSQQNPLPDPILDPLQGTIVSVELANNAAWPGLAGIFRRVSARFCTIRVPGSGTASVSGVALGRGEASLIGCFGPVDHFAAVLIVHEAGGIVMDEFGNKTLNPRNTGFIAARDEACAEELVAIWQESLRELGNGDSSE